MAQMSGNSSHCENMTSQEERLRRMQEEILRRAKEDEEITLSITAENADAYQWEMLDGEDWVPIEAADGTTLDYGLAALEIDGLQLRCVARNEYGETVSPIFTLDVVTPQQDAPGQDAPAVPQTGDGTPLALYAGAMVLIACVLVILRRRAAR